MTRLKAARALGKRYYDKLEVYDKVGIAECWATTGKAPISTRWIDNDKGTKYRSRWVARQFKSDGVDQ